MAITIEPENLPLPHVGHSQKARARPCQTIDKLQVRGNLFRFVI
jgi:hypothetical protein